MSAQKTYSSYGLNKTFLEHKLTQSPSRSNASAIEQPIFGLRLKEKQQLMITSQALHIQEQRKSKGSDSQRYIKGQKIIHTNLPIKQRLSKETQNEQRQFFKTNYRTGAIGPFNTASFDDLQGNMQHPYDVVQGNNS